MPRRVRPQAGGVWRKVPRVFGHPLGVLGPRRTSCSILETSWSVLERLEAEKNDFRRTGGWGGRFSLAAGFRSLKR